MDMDTDDLLKMAQPPTPPQVRFKDSANQTTNSPKEVTKEKTAKKTYLEKTLAKDYPGAEEEVAKRMLIDGKLELTL